MLQEFIGEGRETRVGRPLSLGRCGGHGYLNRIAKDQSRAS